MATERVERRLAAILAADIAGYSRLMGADEEGTHERVKAHFGQLIEPKIKEHRGRIVKNTGDGMLVEFSSVVDAVRCAVETQRAMLDRNADIPEYKRISFRMGINLGDVIVEPEDIFGDGVNIAARLEALAEPGGICISRTVRDHIGERLPYSFEDIGEQGVKNIARPVHVYRIRLDTEREASPTGARGAVPKSSLPLPGLDAWGAYQRGLWHFFKFSSEDNTRAQAFFQEAIDLDPTFAAAYCGLAWAQSQAATTLQTHNLAEAQSSGEALARRAVTLDPADAEAHSTLGLVLWLRGDHKGAVAETRKALAISPNLAFAHALLGATLIFSGQPREGIIAIHTAIRLDPNDPMLPSRLNHVALGHYFCREYETAIEVAKQAIRSNPDFPLSYRWLAAALGQLGRTEEAKEALEKAIAIAPSSFDMYVRGRVPWMGPEDHAHMLEGLPKAGWEG